MALSFLLFFKNQFNQKMSLSLRTFISFGIIAFTFGTSHYVGQYGLQNNIESIF